MEDEVINVQIFVPEQGVQKCLTVFLDESVWEVKKKLLMALQEPLPQPFNYGLFLPPCDGRAGKFLLEDRCIRDYPFHDCVPYLELKYKKRVYKMLKMDEKQLKQMHTKANLKRFMEYVQSKNVHKVEKMCSAGLDPNFHDSQGETPLTIASGISNNRDVIVALVGGGAHLDFRNNEGQTAMHKAAFLSSVENVRCLLELGASPNYRDPLGLTPLYYSMLTSDSNADVAEMLLKDASDICVMDMHGNHELHQACKNGLMHHVEHLLYYGANIDAQNVNGNTPLHVCAVNNRPECCRVLLFRGADPTIVNKQGQSALHVAHIVDSPSVAEIISMHNPADAVPYRGQPVYNPKRRLSTLSRRRSASQSSMCSLTSEYRTPTIHAKHLQMASPSPSRVTVGGYPLGCTVGEYGTLRKFSPDSVMPIADGHEVNIPRILVIPRGPKGFGFILRGVKNPDMEQAFQPSQFQPALQFFEGVDMEGMAMKAGLRPGDFLLQINGVDVRTASHDQVVQLIQASGDVITLKVITVDRKILSSTRISAGETIGRRNQSDGEESMYGPLIGPYSQMMPAKSMETLSGYSSSNEQMRCASVKQRPSASRRISAAELETLMTRQTQGSSQFHPIPFDQDSINSMNGMKFNSVADMKRRKQKQVPSPQLTTHGLPRTTFDNASPAQALRPNLLKSFSSSPDLQTDESDYMGNMTMPTSIARFQDLPDGSPHSDYSRPFKIRPKTPPPPPPLNLPNGKSVERRTAPRSQSVTSDLSSVYASSSQMPQTPSSSKTTNTSVIQVTSNSHLASAVPATSVTSNPPPPPPPPPPPADLLKPKTAQASSNGSMTKQKNVTSNSTSNSNTLQRTDGISAEALSNVRLKPAPKRDFSQPQTPSMCNNSSGMNLPSDFDSDLRSALAKRRSKVSQMEEAEGDHTRKVVFSLENPSAVTSVSRYGGLSLRESVKDSVATPSKSTPKPQISPPGFGSKKDSGYTSSRTSLEPSECGEDPNASTSRGTAVSPTTDQHIGDTFPPPPPAELLNAAMNKDSSLNTNSRVLLLSHQIEEAYGNGSPPPIVHKKPTIKATPPVINEQDAISVTSSVSTLSGCSSERPIRQMNRIFQNQIVDFTEDEPDSGTGDSDTDYLHNSTMCGQSTSLTVNVGFENKDVSEWNPNDVAEWLDSLRLSEHRERFLQRRISGRQLLNFDRSQFTQLGVTRIAHRQTIENSIKTLLSS